MTELLEILRAEAEERVGNEAEAPEIPEADTGPYLEIPIIPEEPEAIAVREGIHERIQAEIQHEEKEAEVMAEEMFDTPPAWNKVPDLMMETKDGRTIPEPATKQKRDELAWGRRKQQRKQQREDEIRPEKHEHSPMVTMRTGHPREFYSEELD